MLRLLLLLVVAAVSAHAQPTVVAGRVVAADTGFPLPGAHVFAESTTLGGVTDADGRFELHVPSPRALVFRASLVGFKPGLIQVRPAPGDTARLTFGLRADTTALAGVEVTAERDRAWEQSAHAFERVLIGATPNSASTRVVNPLALSFEPDSEWTRVRAAEPLVVRNDALGYEVTLFDLAAAFTLQFWEWEAGIAFRDLCAPECSSDVAARRLDAYRGSPAHFLSAAARGALENEGFKAELVDQPGGVIHPPQRLLRRFGVGRERPFELERTPDGWVAPVDGAVWVEFRGERNEHPGRRPGDPQRSWFEVDSGVLRLGPERSMLTPRDLTLHGYWSWQRLADLLPIDYEPR
jgi:hypothetical protein